MPVTDTKVITPVAIARPDYLVPVLEPGFGTTLTRIGGTTGAPIPGLSGATFWSDCRHGYSRRNPWNCDGTLAYLEQRGGTPSKFIVDAKTWQPIRGNTGNFKSCTEVRWHPLHPTRMVGWNKNTLELVVFDALSDALIKRVKVGIAGMGLMGEGSLSNNGSMVALGDTANNAVLVDLASGRVGPVHHVDFAMADAAALGNLTISPLSTPAGGKVIFKASDTPEYGQVCDYGADLIPRPHAMSAGALRMRLAKGAAGAAAGIIACVSHGDVGLTPDGREVWVGGVRDYGDVNLASYSSKYGRVIAMDLNTGVHTHISAGETHLGSKEAADQHCSCRGPKGWVLTTYAGPHETSGRFLMELVLWKLDGSRECVRFGVTRTNEAGMYRAEAHGVCRPDGRAVMFATNSQHASNPKGVPTDIKSCVYTLDGAPPPPPPPPPPPAVLARFYVDPAGTYVPPGVIIDRVTGRFVPLAEVVNLMNRVTS